MSLPGEEKEIRMQQASSLGYNNNNNNNNIDNNNNPILTTTTPSDKLLPNPFSVGSKTSKPGGPTTPRPAISYRECLKNHAANIGGHVTDGCGEFMPSGEDGTLEALRCAACSCHRNFHRKDHHHGGGDHHQTPAMVHSLQLPPPLPSPSMSHHHHRAAAAGWSPMVQPVKMAFGGGTSAGTDSSSEELNFTGGGGGGVAPPPPQFVTKKRFRTKFTVEQKEKMLEFAERLGWRIPREDDTEVQRFCGEVGVKRQVFKVWMHNNKSTSSSSSSKKPPEDQI